MSGMVSPEAFWRLSYYDFILTCHSIKRRAEDESAKLTAIESYVRNVYTLLYNVNRGKKPSKSAEQLWPIKKRKNEPDMDFVQRVREFEKQRFNLN